jgi:hypothetical protein
MLMPYYSVENKIGDKGCKYLSRASLSRISDLNLGTSFIHEGSNEIGNAGMLHLSKSQYKTIKRIFIRIKSNI